MTPSLRVSYLFLATCFAAAACGEVKVKVETDSSVPIDSTVPIDGTQCPSGWTGDGCNIFFDDFERIGMLGPNWQTINSVGNDLLAITSNKACGDIQAPALLQERIDSIGFSTSMDFEATSDEGFEVGYIFTREDNVDNELFIAGCDGGGTDCRLRIGKVGAAPLAELVVPGLVIDTPYTLTVELLNNSLTLSATDGITTLGTITAPLPLDFIVKRFGVVVGRKPDLRITCIDNFLLELD